MEDRKRCALCGHEATDTPNGSFDKLLFKQMGRETFGEINADGLCEVCVICKAEYYREVRLAELVKMQKYALN